jgi:two-component system, OmpR family, phosphate regulon response regulator PhoB
LKGTTMRSSIIIGSSDVQFALLLRHIIRQEGLGVSLAANAPAILSLASSQAGGLLLDGEMHAANSVCRRLKRSHRTARIAIIVLLGSDRPQRDEFERAGVTETLVRPVEPEQFLGAIFRAIPDRPIHRHDTMIEKRLQEFSDLQIDLSARRVKREGTELHLTPIEFDVLKTMMSEPERVFSREELLAAAWPNGVHVGRETVNVHIARLRKALMSTGGSDLVRTIRGSGYALCAR